HYWQAKTALERVEAHFTSPAGDALNSADQLKDYMAALDGDAAYNYEDRGDAERLFAKPPKGSRELTAAYQVPYLAHACMEPMNCTVDARAGACEIWVGAQSVSLVRDAVAELLDLDEEEVTVHATYLGGGFGRRSEVDFALQAAQLSKAAGRPVQLIWSREEDIRHDTFRPMAVGRLKGLLGSDGGLLALAARTAGQSVTANFMGRVMPVAATAEPDPSSVEGLAFTPYEIPHRRVDHSLMENPVPVGFWRSVGHSFNAFFGESFMDELAHEAGRDAFAFRRALLAGHPRQLAVLDKLEAASRWGSVSGDGPRQGQKRGQGLALHLSFGSIVGQVMDISVIEGAVRIEKVTCVIDCGQIVNPSIIEAQMESGIIFGLTAAFFGEITLQDGAVLESNFHDYRMLRMAQTPLIETHIMPSVEAPGGVGEPGTPPAAPALLNAIFAATGKRYRRLPLAASDLAPI
ncbi:MAG: molybdopterin cofactor-binding domain-containing protein, partial [Sphingomonadales bacterium]